MKRIITLITLVAISVPMQAQQQFTQVDSSPALAFYATPEWQEAFMGNLGVDPGVEPGRPEDSKELEVLGQVRNLLQTGNDANVLNAVTAISTLMQQQRST
jgi:hypothetical protein